MKKILILLILNKNTVIVSDGILTESGEGSLEIGADVDITIFSLNEIEDQATFENTTLPPKGIKYVIINGKLALIDNKIINFNSSKSIRKFL